MFSDAYSCGIDDFQNNLPKYLQNTEFKEEIKKSEYEITKNALLNSFLRNCIWTVQNSGLNIELQATMSSM
jgi:hypothetical protein